MQSGPSSPEDVGGSPHRISWGSGWPSPWMGLTRTTEVTDKALKKKPTTHKNKTWGSKVIPSADICPIRTNHGLLRTAGFGVPGNALNLL